METRLSLTTSARVDWALVGDGARLLLGEIDTDRGRAASAESTARAGVAVDQAIVQRAFEQARQEFARVLAPTKRSIQWAFVIVVVALALTVSGGALSFLGPWWRGGLLSLAGLGTMLGYLRRAWLLTRDQLLLELVPARYELALTLATSPTQYAQILREFLKETDSLKSR
jgi:hypothetical protein